MIFVTPNRIPSGHGLKKGNEMPLHSLLFVIASSTPVAYSQSRLAMKRIRENETIKKCRQSSVEFHAKDLLKANWNPSRPEEPPNRWPLIGFKPGGVSKVLRFYILGRVLILIPFKSAGISRIASKARVSSLRRSSCFKVRALWGERQFQHCFSKMGWLRNWYIRNFRYFCPSEDFHLSAWSSFRIVLGSWPVSVFTVKDWWLPRLI